MPTNKIDIVIKAAPTAAYATASDLLYAAPEGQFAFVVDCTDPVLLMFSFFLNKNLLLVLNEKTNPLKKKEYGKV